MAHDPDTVHSVPEKGRYKKLLWAMGSWGGLGYSPVFPMGGRVGQTIVRPGTACKNSLGSSDCLIDRPSLYAQAYVA